MIVYFKLLKNLTTHAPDKPKIPEDTLHLSGIIGTMLFSGYSISIIQNQISYFTIPMFYQQQQQAYRFSCMCKQQSRRERLPYLLILSKITNFMPNRT